MVVGLRSRQSLKRASVHEASSASSDDNSEPAAASRVPKRANLAESVLMEELCRESGGVPLVKPSTADFLNLCFEVSGTGSHLFDAEEYDDAAEEDEKGSMVDSALGRCTELGLKIPSVSPLMVSLYSDMKSAVWDVFCTHVFNYCSQMVSQKPDLQYTFDASEFCDANVSRKRVSADCGGRVCARDHKCVKQCCLAEHKWITSPAKLQDQVYSDITFETMCKITKHVKLVRQYKSLNKSLARMVKWLSANWLCDAAPMQEGNFPSGNSQATQLDDLTLWMCLFATSSLVPFRVTGVWILSLLAAQISENSSVQSIIEERLADVDSLVAIQAYLALCSKKMELLPLVLKHPAALVRAHAFWSLGQFLGGLTREAASLEALQAVAAVAVPFAARSAFDGSAVVRLISINFLDILVKTDAAFVKAGVTTSSTIDDTNVTTISQLLFNSPNSVYSLLVLTQLVSVLVFTSDIIDAGKEALDLVCSTLVQFLADYADDPKWRPFHGNAILGYFVLCDPLRDVEKIWDYFHRVYKPVNLGDQTSENDWLAKPNTTNALLTLMHRLWSYHRAFEQRRLLRNQTADGFSLSDEAALAILSHPPFFNRTSGLPWDSSPLLVAGTSGNPAIVISRTSAKKVEQLVNTLQPLLHRSFRDKEQYSKMLSFLYDLLLSYHKAAEDRQIISVDSAKEVLGQLGAMIESNPLKDDDPSIMYMTLMCSKLTSVDEHRWQQSFQAELDKTANAVQQLIKRYDQHLRCSIDGANGGDEVEKELQRVVNYVDEGAVDSLRCELIKLRVLAWVDPQQMITNKLQLLDDILAAAETAAHLPLNLIDFHIVVNGLDLVWLAQIRLLELLTLTFNRTLLPTLNVVKTKLAALQALESAMAASTMADRTEMATALQALDQSLVVFKEDLDVYKELSLQVSCYAAIFSDRCRKVVILERNGEDDPAVRNRLLTVVLSCLQCCRILVWENVCRYGTPLWTGIQDAMEVLQTLVPAASKFDSSLANLNHAVCRDIGGLALNATLPMKPETTLEIAHALDALKQLYASKRREVEETLVRSGDMRIHNIAFFDNFIVASAGAASAAEAAWDEYKNLTSARAIESYLHTRDVARTAFSAKIQLTTAVTQIPDKVLWVGSSIGPVILSYFRSRSPTLRKVAEVFVGRCLEADKMRSDSDLTDRPLIMVLFTSTLLTLVKKALSTAENREERLKEVEEVACEMLQVLPVDYFESLSDLLFMSFVWNTIQQAHEERKGHLFGVLEMACDRSGMRLMRPWSDGEAAKQFEALKEIARGWYQTQGKKVLQVEPELFSSNLTRFLHACFPFEAVANLTSDWRQIMTEALAETENLPSPRETPSLQPT